MKKIISWIIIIAAGFWVFSYIKKNPEEFVFLRRLSFADIGTLVSVSALTIFFMGLKTKIYMNYFGARIRFVEWFGLEFVASLINYLPLRGGFLSKAVYLKKYHAFPYAHFTTLLAALNLISLFCLGVAGLISMGIVTARYGIHNTVLTALLIASIGLSLLLFLFPFKKPQKRLHQRWVAFMLEVAQEWSRLKKSRATVFQLLLAEFAINLSAAAKLFLIFRMLSLPLPFLSCVIIAAFSSLSAFIPLAPASLGVKEAAISITASVVGSRLKEGIVVSLIDRAASMLVVFSLGVLFFFVLFGKERKLQEVLSPKA